MTEAMKTCIVCGEDKPRSGYSPHGTFRDGLHRECKDCRNRIYRERYAGNIDQERERSRARTRKHRTGVTDMEYRRLLRAQKGRCAICDKTSADDGGAQMLAVDHDHTSGLVRGLLCHKCNMSLGMMNDDPVLLSRAATYLLEHAARGDARALDQSST